MEFMKMAERQIPIYKKKEVLIVGGGVAGMSAAVASSRAGCKPLILEHGGSLGGTVTLGMNTNFMGVEHSINKGFFGEFFEELKEREALIDGFHSPIDPEIFKCLAFEYIEKEGVELLLHTSVIDVLKDQNDRLAGILIYNKSGIQAILGDVIIDASGDADVAAMAGEPFEQSEKDDHALTLLFRVGGANIQKFTNFVHEHDEEFRSIGKPQDDSYLELDREKPLVAVGGFHGFIKKAREKGELYLTHDNMWVAFLPTAGTALINATHAIGFDPVNAGDLTLAEIECRKQMLSVYSFIKREIPGFENAFLMDSASHIGIRESRRIKGKYVLKYEDIQKENHFDDSIALNFMPIDIHGPGEKQTWIKLERPYEIPFRTLQPKVTENLLVCGRCISVDHMLQGSIRNVPCCFATGQAAGTAAALSFLEKKNPRELDIKHLQDELKGQGVVIYPQG